MNLFNKTWWEDLSYPLKKIYLVSIISMIVVLFCVVIAIVHISVENKLNAKWRNTIKKGDSCNLYFPDAKKCPKAVIDTIDGNNVKITLIVPKSNIYR